MIKLAAFADEADASVDGQIQALKRNGIEYIEIRGVDGKNISQLTEDEAKNMPKYMRTAVLRFGPWVHLSERWIFKMILKSIRVCFCIFVNLRKYLVPTKSECSVFTMHSVKKRRCMLG